MGGKILKKSDLNRFLYKIKTKSDLIAPVKTDIFRFEKVQFISQINLDENPSFSPKQFLMPNEQLLFEFKESKISLPKTSMDQVLFGLRLCDISAINALDKIFLNKDIKYSQARANTVLIGLHCTKELTKNCFCTSMDQNNIADLFFYDIGDNYYIKVGTEKGLKLVSRLKDYEYEPDKTKTKKRLKRFDIIPYYNDESFIKLSKSCISCGLCTIACPSCLCHSYHDYNVLEKNSGKRVRHHNSCQHDGFWKNSDNKLVLSDKTYKLKHRIFHKLSYFKNVYGTDMCTGCGRCINMCPAKIDFAEAINNLK